MSDKSYCQKPFFDHNHTIKYRFGQTTNNASSINAVIFKRFVNPFKCKTLAKSEKIMLINVCKTPIFFLTEVFY